ncbi:hypothetical protein GQ457_09G013270 [Hibiscus cannabinus]
MTDFVEEVKYPQWLANVVMVKNSSDKWRMFIDFTDLNKACPKDSFPFRLVDASTGHNFTSFIDAFSGYNQITMAKKDKEQTTFITGDGFVLLPCDVVCG